MFWNTIPTFLSIDVEPDGFQLERSGSLEWGGFDALFRFLQKLRAGLQDRCGTAPRLGWYFRTDPQIAEVSGRATHVLEKYPNHLAQMSSQGDYFGVHVHPVRWSNVHAAWVHDIGDAAWLRHAIRFAVTEFAQWAGSPVQRFRMGAGFLNNDVIATLEEMRVTLDLSLEPVSGWGLIAKTVQSGVDESPIVGSYLDCQQAPRETFRPSIADFRIPDRKAGRQITMIPLTTYVPEILNRWQRFRRRLRGQPLPSARVLYPSLEWPSPKHFWDLAERQVRSMRRPYLSLAIRTDAADVILTQRERDLMEALLTHPLSKRLRFIDPLEAVKKLA